VLGRGPAYTVHLAPAERSFTGRRGDSLQEHGHAPVTAAGGPLPESGHETSDERVHHCQVSGTHHMPRGLGDSRFDLGTRIQLKLQPGAADDALAVGIWDAAGAVQVGFLPATLSRMLAGALRRGTPLGGQVIREVRLGAGGGERLALYVLVSPPGRLQFVYHHPRDAVEGAAGD
jgi:hypothetical protein